MIELVCVLVYAIYFPRLPIVKYYRSKAASEGSKTVSADLAAAGFQEQASDIEVWIATVFRSMNLFWSKTNLEL